MERLLSKLESVFYPKQFENIEFVVVQSGVGLDLGKQKNTGTFNPDRLEKMLEVCKKFGKKSKEHNVSNWPNSGAMFIESKPKSNLSL